MKIAHRKHYCRICKVDVFDNFIRNDICTKHAEILNSRFPNTTRKARMKIFGIYDEKNII